ncbi:MAG: 3-mercaptopyruvate sulfurtransferase [Candidatus Puniceispirillaceae bacterium]
MSTLVTATWLKDHLDEVIVLDASSHLPTAGRNPLEEFEAAHIPGAQRFDIDRIADPDSHLPHMVPSAEDFSAHMRALGLTDSDHVVIYDDSDIKSAARGWWMMRLFGHATVSILDGGLTAWRAVGGGLEAVPARQRPAGSFSAGKSAGADVVDMAALQSWIEAGTAGQILDARAAARFAGEAPEPRKGLRAGHIPGSRNLPFTRLLNEDGTYRDAEALRDLFTASGISPDAPVAASCGSGVTACVLAVGLHLLGNEDVAVYDGSWTEWGASNAPIETGPPQ